MNNLTIAFEEHDGFRKLVEDVAKWMNVVPAGEDAHEWLLDGTPNCDECRQRQKEEVDDLEAELRRVRPGDLRLRGQRCASCARRLRTEG